MASIIVFYEVVGIYGVFKITNGKQSRLGLLCMFGTGVFFEMIRIIDHKIIKESELKSSDISYLVFHC